MDFNIESRNNSTLIQIQSEKLDTHIAPALKSELVLVSGKGEKNIIRIRVSPWYKYYSGKFETAGEASGELNRIRKKYPEAFMVIVENGIPRALKKSELP